MSRPTSQEPRGSSRAGLARMPTGVANLDPLLGGGIPVASMVVIAGPPGSGKTILAQQISFHNATAERKVAYFSTLSEPAAKTLRYLTQFDFFDPERVESHVELIDLGAILRGHGLADAGTMVMEHVKRVKPAIVVIDSFKVFDDLASKAEELRKFGYQLAVSLMAWEVTTLLLGEYGEADVGTCPLFSIADGLILVGQERVFGEERRSLQVRKMRGTAHERSAHSFVIDEGGVHVFAPRSIRRERRPTTTARSSGIAKLDALLGGGIPSGASVLVSGAAGTGKTILLLELLYRGALAGEKGLYFSFEESDERLVATAAALGWDLRPLLAAGLLEIVFIPLPDIDVPLHLERMRTRVETHGSGRVAIDSLSVFLRRIDDPEVCREITFQLATIVHNAGAVGFFATDIPYGSDRVSRLGVEETVVDGVLLLSSTREGLERNRTVEVYKMRDSAHLEGRHAMAIGEAGVEIVPRYDVATLAPAPSPPLDVARLTTGVGGLDDLLGGGLLARSSTLVAGSAGAGKTWMGLQFAAAGAERGERAIFVALEEGSEPIRLRAEGLAAEAGGAQGRGGLVFCDLRRARTSQDQFLAVLTDLVVGHAAKRIVLDGIAQLATQDASEELRRLVGALVHRFKVLEVTSLLTLETPWLTSLAQGTGRAVSPFADNLLLLRYERRGGSLLPTVTVVKTRGSAHDRGTFALELSASGARVGARADAPQSRAPGGGT